MGVNKKSDMESNQYDETKKKGNFMKNVFCVIYITYICLYKQSYN